jgi:hypothetical protein
MSETKGIGCVPQGARTAQNEDAVFQAFKKDRTLSIRSIANMFNISKSTMQWIPRDNRRHYTQVQNILSESLSLRLQFCEWFLQKQIQEVFCLLEHLDDRFHKALATI